MSRSDYLNHPDYFALIGCRWKCLLSARLIYAENVSSDPTKRISKRER